MVVVQIVIDCYGVVGECYVQVVVFGIVVEILGLYGEWNIEDWCYVIVGLGVEYMY